MIFRLRILAENVQPTHFIIYLLFIYPVYIYDQCEQLWRTNKITCFLRFFAMEIVAMLDFMALAMLQVYRQTATIIAYLYT